MIELKNSRTKYLGRSFGIDRYSLDAFIGAVQMREPGGAWQDIKPRLVRDGDGWHIEGAPYHAEMKDDGMRLFCPDRNERGKYLRIPAPPLFAGLDRNVLYNPTKIDGEVLPNQITLPAEWGEIRIIFGNTGMRFEVLFTKAPPAALFGKDSPRILLDADVSGLDIDALLEAKAGLGIPSPRLLKENLDFGEERRLGWSYKNGQMELGFDLTGLEFPVLLKNTTVDEQVEAGGDDGQRYGSTSFSNYYADVRLGYYSWNQYHAFFRFTGVTIPAGATIDAAYLSYYIGASGSGSPQTDIWGVDEDNPAAPTSYSEYDADPKTTASVSMDSAQTLGDWINTPSIVSIIQELVDSYDYSAGKAMMFKHETTGGSNGDWVGAARTYEYSGHAHGPKLHIEYTEGGATEKTSSENGSGADASALAAAISRAETGSGSDGGQPSAGLAVAETGGGTDGITSLLAGLVKNETGAGAEHCLLSLLLTAADSGGGIEALAAQLAGLLNAEAGSGSESIAGRAMVLGDFVNGSDASLALFAAIAGEEAGSSAEQALLGSFVAKLAAETGFGSDMAGLIAALSAIENGLGADSGWLVGLRIIVAGDVGAAIETLKALIQTSGKGTDMKLSGGPGQVRIPSKGVSL